MSIEPVLIFICLGVVVLAALIGRFAYDWLKSRRTFVLGPHVVTPARRPYDVRWYKWKLECKYCDEAHWEDEGVGEFSDDCEGFI